MHTHAQIHTHGGGQCSEGNGLIDKTDRGGGVAARPTHRSQKFHTHRRFIGRPNQLRSPSPELLPSYFHRSPFLFSLFFFFFFYSLYNVDDDPSQMFTFGWWKEKNLFAQGLATTLFFQSSWEKKSF
jgi:hypothetical protein